MPAAAHLAPFRLTLEGIPADSFSVQRWRIEADIDAPYKATVVIQVPLDRVTPFGLRPERPLMGLPAVFELQAQSHTWEPIHGRIAQSSLGSDLLDPESFGFEGGEVITCSLVLRPRMWWASLGQTSRTFQRQSVEETVCQVLRGHGLTAQDIDFRLSAPLARERYRQQYQESDLAFVTRLLERAGLTFFFEQRAEREVLVVTDSAAGYSRPAQWSGVRYAPEAGLSAPPDDGTAGSGFQQVLTRFSLAHQATTTDHTLDDYNYRSASTGLNVEQPGVKTQLGRISSYGTHAKTPEEAALHLRHQAERTAQHARRCEAASTLTALAPGQSIGIVAEPATPAGAAGRWLVLSVAAWGDRQVPYTNRFAAQPEATPYRPEWDTPRPKMAGVTHMRLDTTDSANPYARLDQHGRYLAWHYFEHGRSQDGMGSAPIRLVRDSSGPTYGQHFPVHAGVEALAGYVHGDPDRPVLLGVVHDSANPNPVTSANASRHVLRTWANNKLRMEDESGREHVKLSTEYGLSQLNLGHLVDQNRESRGQGFELRTDHEGALRAERGWLLSTAGTNVRGDPRGEGHQLHTQPVEDLLQAVRPWADNRSKAATQVGLEAASSLKAADAFEQNLPGLKTPMQVSFGQAGLVLSARKNVAFGAEQDQGFYSVGPINLVSGEPFGLTAKKGLRLHAEAGGLQQVVSDGDYTVHVQKGDWTVLAKDAAMFESKTGVVRFQTKGGQYFIEVGPDGFRTNARRITTSAGEKIDFTGGSFSGEAGVSAGLAKGLDFFGKMNVKDTGFDDRFVLKDRAGSPIEGAPFTVRNLLTGETGQGRTDANGHVTHSVDGSPENLQIKFG